MLPAPPHVVSTTASPGCAARAPPHPPRTGPAVLCPGTHVVGEGVRGDPGDGLPQHLRLVVDALDGEEDLAGNRARARGEEGHERSLPSLTLPHQRVRQGSSLAGLIPHPKRAAPRALRPPGAPHSAHLAQGAGGDNVVEELDGQAPAELDGLDMALARPRECGEEEAHGEGIVQVPQRVHEGRVPAPRQERSGESHPVSTKGAGGDQERAPQRLRHVPPQHGARRGSARPSAPSVSPLAAPAQREPRHRQPCWSELPPSGALSSLAAPKPTNTVAMTRAPPALPLRPTVANTAQTGGELRGPIRAGQPAPPCSPAPRCGLPLQPGITSFHQNPPSVRRGGGDRHGEGPVGGRGGSS